MSRIRRILHPSDFSRASGAAFTRAVDLARANKAELLLAHVLTPTVPVVGDGYVSPKIYEDLAASARDYGKKNLGALVAKAAKKGVRARSLLLEGVRADRAGGAAAADRPRGDGHPGADRPRQALPRQRGRPGRRDLFVPGDDGARKVAVA